MEKKQVKRIFVLEEKCNGCRICELRCSFYHEQVYSPSLSRIHVVKKEVDGYTKPKTCVICGKCIEACPEKAITKSEETGAISISIELCKGHKDCVDVCPYDVMRFNELQSIAFTCDLCDGDPQCVKYCPEEALFFLTPKEFITLKKEYQQKKVSGEIGKPEVIP